MKASTSDSKSHLLGLDLLRLFAACLVVFNHLGVFSAARPDVGSPFAFPSLNFIARFGWVGVEIFFVISGFVIALSANGESTAGFVKRRIVRLWPALVVCSLISAIALWIIDTPLPEILSSLFRSITLFPLGPYVDGVVWSLIAEAVFYLAIALLLFGRQFHNLDRFATAMGVVSAAFLSTFAVLLLWRGEAHLNELFSLFERFVFKFSFLRYGVFFAFGMTLWLSFEYGFTKRRTFLCILWAAFAALEIAMHGASDCTLAKFVSAMPLTEAMIIPVALWMVAMALFLLSVIFSSEIGEKLNTRMVRKLGLMTYALYLNHYTLGRVFVYELISAHVAASIVFVLALVVIFGLSWLIVVGPEPAIQRQLRKLLKLDASRRNQEQALRVPLSA